MASPKVTVIMVTSNSQEFLTIALESVLRQTYRNIEVVVCDQSSTDETYSILKSFDDARLRVSESAENNYFACINEAARLATGDFVLEFSAKGIMKPTMVESLVTTTTKENKTIGAVPRFIKVDNDGVIIGEVKAPKAGDEMALALLTSDELADAPLFLRHDFIRKPLYRVHQKQPKLGLLWSINKKGGLLITQEYLAASRSKRSSELGLWNKRYTIFKLLWHFPKTIRNLGEEARRSYGELMAELYKTALKKRDYVFGLVVISLVLRRPGYRHEFVRIIRQAKQK